MRGGSAWRAALAVGLSLALSGCTDGQEGSSLDAAALLSADLSWEPADPLVGQEVRFTAAVLGPAGDPLAMAGWSIEGTMRSGMEAVHTFAAAGAHDVVFTARTVSGTTLREEASVRVAGSGPAATTSPSPTPSPSPSPTGTPSPTPGSSTPPEEPLDHEPVIVAVLDTGILAGHEAFAQGQVVAWHDFGRNGDAGIPVTLWDPATEPYDDDGHGTAVASLVGGTGQHTPSHAPGVRLAIAKISDSTGAAYWDDVARAMQWATDVVGADVLSFSFYGYLPDPLSPAFGHPLLDSLERARAQGTLPVVLAGNGANNMGLPTMSWMHPPATSRSALVVGGASSSGSAQAPLGSMDPEVTALYTTDYACPGSATCYGRGSGTSFSTPLVAGMAARLLEVARSEGLDEPDADRLELILKGSARDTLAQPTFEGHGFLDADALATAIEHVRAGTMPELDPVNELYVETLASALRGGWGG